MFVQSFLPDFPDGALPIGKYVKVLTQGNTVTYFVGDDNYIDHRVGDKKGQRFALCLLMANDHVRAIEIERSALAIPHRTLMNWKARYSEGGADALLTERRVLHKPRVITAEKSAECSVLLAEGYCAAEVARRTGIDESTLRKAIRRKAVVLPEGTGTGVLSRTSMSLAVSEAVGALEAESSATGVVSEALVLSTKSVRSQADAKASDGIGTACTRADERIAVAIGLAEGAVTRFEPSADVPMGGLLVGLPALCANGLLSGIGKYLTLPSGFYSCLHILLTLGFMALGRIRRPENLRHIPPGELGKVIGLDRVPEVRTLRKKLSLMASTGNPGAWMQELSKGWMEEDPDEAGYLYVDGHVRVYHGKLADLPRRYVSRERLCLRGTTDYWINDALGRPFFVVSKAINEGMAAAILQDIVPDLLITVPGQPSAEALAANSQLHRFILVFDREGATNSLLSQLWVLRIGSLTYRKNVKDTWPEVEFIATEVSMPDGGRTTMKLAMRQTRLGQSKDSVCVKEVRRLTDTGHQTAVICTAMELDIVTIAGRMFARWCQENFFAYMMQHYDIDGLLQYGAQDIPGTEMVVNPKWRILDKEVTRSRNLVRKLEAKLGASTEIVDGALVQQSAECLQSVEAAKATLERAKSERKLENKKVTIESLPKDERPTQLVPLNKQLADAVKMIAYRAETALVGILRRYLKNEDEGRALIRALLVAAADIVPDKNTKTLTVRIHRMSCPAHDQVVERLLSELTAAEFCHPETGDLMIYALV